MINFREEIKQFKPITQMENVSETVSKNDMQDILELLLYIKNKAAQDNDKE